MTALQELQRIYEHATAWPGVTSAAEAAGEGDDVRDDDAATRCIVTSWPSLPVEILRAANYRPVIVRGSPAPTPLADRHLEADVFPSRLRRLIELALGGRLAHVAEVLIPRSSDADYKTFLYLREFIRGGVAATAPVQLFDLLQSHTVPSAEYDRARARALADRLGATPEAVAREIQRTNAARAAARRLLVLREGQPRVPGVEALPFLAAFWHVDPVRYAALANDAVDELAARPPLDGPRLLLCGAPVDGVNLHAAIETLGAVVVAEMSPWGSGMAGDDVRVDADPIGACADKYRLDAIGPRLPVTDAQAWVTRHLDRIDGVVISLPPEDAVFGWDYPTLRRLLDERDIPHARVTGDPQAPLSPEDAVAISALVTRARSRRGVAHG